ncbi:DNA-binding domain-containing protein [Alteromonas flava]|uniref:HvfC family RiPP maturation protein n=1 Tax=Alteromonas flava TaxID=2048003 RepID=UPI000C28ECF3|nr:putative DNA-binding domain-containing protein [Alteromonas flava]
MKPFSEIQRAFTAHIRDPENYSFDDGIEDRRLAIYRELFFNNILGFLDSGFPVLKALFTESDWLKLARTFFSQHECRSPLFVDISKEFVEFLANEYQPTDADPAFLAELAHYEWLELDVSVRKGELPAQPAAPITADTTLQMSVLASLVSYQYPVHQIGPEFKPENAGDPVFLLVYRNADDEVEFMLLNQVTAVLLHTLEQTGTASTQTLVDSLAPMLPQMSPHELLAATIDILSDFSQKRIVGLCLQE